ncbi:MAG: hypothetical protein RBS53_03035 [Bacteroidales bacterium]|jgi:hypothetical protein|nr:hypothetical protein [Bacteroidales bacterium]NLM91996.1 hypothetical protein [Bacteroidales bacterium]
MHDIEPFYSWRNLYIASEDERSPFYRQQYSEIEFTHAIYNYLIHPQWDEIGSATLFIKILYSDYDDGYCIIEMIGEWNDCLYNDIMYLKRNIVEPLIDNGINKFILIGENVLNFHSSDDLYYQEWFEDLEDGWIVALNFRDFVIREFESANIDYYIAFGKHFNDVNWRKYTPMDLYQVIERAMSRRLNPFEG